MNFLTDVYNTCQITSKFPISKIVSKHKVAAYAATCLKEGDVIKSDNKNNYKWVSIRPNMEMAKELDRRVKIKQNEAKDRQLAKKKTVIKPVDKSVVAVKKDMKTPKTIVKKNKVEFSLLWGALTLKF